MKKLLATSMVLAAGCWGAAGDCGALRQLALPATTITIAEPIAQGTFQVPGGGVVNNLPPFCRVAGVIAPSSDSHIRFEVWLPLNKWNGNFQGVGNGGFAGNLNFGGLVGAIHHGYAAATTDTGHEGGGQDAAWALNHPEKMIDFGWRGIHEMTVQGKAITQAFYGQAVKKAYFNSCSNGGRQALMEAQRFPADYDGIIAGAPANYWTRLLSLGLMTAKAAHATPAAYFPAAKLKAIQANVLKACDARDQVTDGVVEEPNACRANEDALLCAGAENDNCLTAAQLQALKTIRRGVVDAKGKPLFPPVSASGEAEVGGWGAWITGGQRESGAMFAFSTQFFKHMVYSDANWDFKASDLQKDIAAAARLAPVLNATETDLSAFQKRGGKLILYHGWCDAAIPAQNSIDYFQAVQKKMGAARAREFVRFFLAPGVQHCGGGAGPNVFGQGGPRGGATAENDLNAALVRWVEEGVAPERVSAAKVEQGKTVRTRPLCAYPLVARWKGTGSTDEAANFECAASSAR